MTFEEEKNDRRGWAENEEPLGKRNKTMKTHIIELSEVLNFLNTEDVTIASSSRERKRLTVDLRGNLKVTIAGREVWGGLNPSEAVREYNKITETYKDERPAFKL